MELVIASTNSHKVLQLREALKELLPEVSLLSLFDFPQYKCPLDTHTSLQERAKARAVHAASTLKKLCLVEQWQLVIPSLGDTKSSESSIVAQTKKILEALKSKPEHERAAYLESAVCVATPQGSFKEATARSEGTIAEKERGSSNFDFDTIFIKHDYSKTLAELAPSTRSRISHRRKAVEKLLSFLHHALSH